jgi:hypothetical protein
LVGNKPELQLEKKNEKKENQLPPTLVGRKQTQTAKKTSNQLPIF